MIFLNPVLNFEKNELLRSEKYCLYFTHLAFIQRQAKQSMVFLGNRVVGDLHSGQLYRLLISCKSINNVINSRSFESIISCYRESGVCMG
jgi:hypothetical protein